MNLRDYGSRTDILLRMAPWADLELIREKLTEHLLKIRDQPNYFSEKAKQEITEFSKGERHVAPSSIRGNNALERVLHELYRAQASSDRRFSTARTEFVHYFFSADYYLGL